MIWTGSRRHRDLTAHIRRWLGQADFVERAFHAPTDVRFSIGVRRFAGVPRVLGPTGTPFTFTV